MTSSTTVDMRSCDGGNGATMIRVGICQWYPAATWCRGGGEVCAEKHVEYLNKIDGVCAEYFHPHLCRDVDILHIIGSNYHLNEFSRYARLQGIRVALNPIAYRRRPAWTYRWWLSALSVARVRTPLAMTKEIISSVDLVMANTNTEKLFVSRAYRIPAERIAVVNQGVDLTGYAAADGKLFRDEFGHGNYVLSVGRVTPWKRQLDILRILSPLPCKVVLIGPPDDGHPEYASAVEDYVTRSDKAFWLKGLPHDSPLLASAYAGSRCHVLWSDGEVAPLVNLEAMAAGTIAVSRPHRTVRDMLGVHGVYASNGSELRAAVEAACGLSDVERSATVASARQFALSTFSWESVAAQTVRLYRELLSSRNTGQDRVCASGR